MKRLSLFLVALLVACSTTPPKPDAAPPAQAPAAAAPQPPALQPPVAKKQPHVLTLHGEDRTDEYFWLKEKTHPEVIAYLEAENAYTTAVMKPTEPLQQRLYDEMLGRIQQTDLSVPYRKGAFLYYVRFEEGKAYPIACRKPFPDGPEQVLVDVNQLAEGQKFMALGRMEVSDDANLLAFSTDNTGFRQYALRIKDLRTGQLSPERIEKTGSLAWGADNKTLFYTVEDPAKRQYRVYRHVVGEDPAKDALVYEERDERFVLTVYRGRSGRFIYLHSGSHTTAEARYLPANKPTSTPAVIAAREQDHDYDVEDRGESFVIRSNATGRNYAVMTAPVKSPARKNWKPLVAHRDGVIIHGVDVLQDHLVLFEREEAVPYLTVHDLARGGSHRISFPEANYTVRPGPNEEFATTTYRFSYESSITPSSVFDYDLRSRERKLLKEQPVLGGYDRTQYETARIEAVSHDGARIPVSIVFRKSTPRDGSSPVILNAYGAYGFPAQIMFSSNAISLLDRGVILATGHIRGGSDKGKPWHDAGRMLNKRNSFHDLIAAAEALIAQKYAAPKRLAITGGSAGGLLVSAATNMRPELFAAVLNAVPFVDVITTMSDPTLPLTVGEFEEWGNPQVAADYAYMKSYDPYLNLGRKAYPPMLVKTGLNDSQVMYWEPAKYVARMRALRTDSNPLLLKVNMAAGHGGASSRYDKLREVAFDYAFLLTQLGVEQPPLATHAPAAAASN